MRYLSWKPYTLSNMKFDPEKLKILHLTSGLAGKNDVVNQVFEQQKREALERKVVTQLEDFRTAILKGFPDVILVDHTSSFNYALAALEILEQNELDLPFILLIDTASEQEAINLYSEGVDDYLFLDRPNRLPASIQKIRRKYKLKAESAQLALKLAQNDRKFKSLIENSADAILILHPDGHNTYMSPSVEKILGYSENDAKQLNFYSLVHPEEQPAIEEGFLSCLEMPGIPFSGIPVRVKGRSGRYYWLEATFTNLLDEPEINGIVANFRDISRNKEAEQAIRESEEKYRSFFVHSMDGILITVTDGEILAANPAACGMFQMTEEEICQAGRFGIVDPEDQRVAAAIKERQKNGQVKAEITFMRKDGSKFPGEVTSSVFTNAAGEERTSMILRDLSEKESAEQEKEAVLKTLRNKRAKLLTAQRIAKLGYWEQDLETQALYWTEEVFRIWGVSKDTFCPSFDFILQTVHPEDRKRFISENSAAMSGIRNLDIEHRIVLPDGSIKWVHERGALALTESGKRVFEGTVQDITEEILNRQKLETSEARIRGILKSQTNYLIRIDLEGNYSYCNDKFYQDFQWIFPDKNPIGKPALSSVKESCHSNLKTIHDRCISQPNIVVQAEVEKLQKDGGEKYTFWDFVCLTDSDGNALEIQAVGIDITDRIEAERSLIESNQRYELVTKATSDAIYDWDCLTGKVLWSKNYSRLFGYSQNSAPATVDSWASNVHEEDEKILADLSEVLKGKSNFWQAEYRYRKFNGEYAHVLEKGTIVRSADGEAVRMVGAIQDITERKETLEKLMHSEARHKGIIQSQTNYVIRTDMEGNYSYCNDKFIQEFGWIYEGKSLVGENSMISVMEYHHDRLTEVAQKCLVNPGQVFQVELDKPGKNKTVKTTLWDLIYLTGSAGQKEELQCVGIDITDRVKAERENIFQANLLDKIGQAVIATDSMGKITYWNKAATTIYGWSREEVMGRNIIRITPSKKSREQGDRIMEALKQGKTWSGEFLVQRKDGTEFPVLVTNSPFYDECGDFIGFIGVSSDITERKNADNKLLELNRNLRNYTAELVTANKGLEQFSYIVSHNLRAPVANILGLGELLTTEDYPHDLKQQLLQEVISNIRRLDTIITDLNDILQVKVDMSEKKEQIDLMELTQGITHGIGRIIKQEKVEVRTDFSDFKEFHAPKSYLHSIFSNLIFNSIKYRRPGVKPVIEIKTKEDQDHWVFEFRDNGMGMDLKRRENQVFGLYKRFHTHVEGKGMGLFMVKTQVELMGGKIEVFSKVNEGTRFVLEFKKEKVNGINEDEEKKAVPVGG